MTQNGDAKSRSARRSGDDFRKIDGIGRVLEQRLWDAGILTYDDLARRAPEEIAAVLAPMAGITPERIASQARELAGPPAEASVPRQHYAAFHVEFLLESDDSVRRTKIRHHQTDARDAWPGWDEDRLLSFLRDRIPLPATAAPADASAVEPTQPQPDESAGVEPAPTGQLPATTSGWLPSWSLYIEELAPIGDGGRSHILSTDESTSVRLTMRIDTAGAPIRDTFAFSVALVARRFAGHDRSPLGTAHGTIRAQDPASVEVTGPALPADLYRLVATVEIYPGDHSPEDLPIYRMRAAGDLIRVSDAPLRSAPAVA